MRKTLKVVILFVLCTIFLSCAPKAPEAPVLRHAILTNLGPPAPTWAISFSEAYRDYFMHMQEKEPLEGLLLEETLIDIKSSEWLRTDPSVLSIYISNVAELSLPERWIMSKKEPQIVTFTSLANPTVLDPQRWFYPLAPLWEEQAFSLMRWLQTEDWKREISPKVGVIATTDAYGHGIVAGTKVWCRESGWQIFEESVDVRSLNYIEELKTMLDHNVDYLFIALYPSETATLLRDMNNLGIVGKFRLLTTFLNTPDRLPSELWHLIEDAIIPLPLSRWDDPESISIREMRAVRTEYGHPVPADTDAYIQGWFIAKVIYEATRIAVGKGIAPININRESFKKALDEIEELPPHMLGLSITITPEDHRLGRGLKMARVKNGMAIPVSPFFEVATFQQ